MTDTKILVPLGPATSSETVIRQLMLAGVTVFRRKASQGTQPEQGARIRTFRQVPREFGVQAGILFDLQGPQICLGRLNAAILAVAAARAARDRKVAAIVGFTARSSARLDSRFPPPVSISGMTPRESVGRQLTADYAVQPIPAPDESSTDEMPAHRDEALTRGYVPHGDLLVFLAGQPVGRPATTHLMQLDRLGESER